MPTLAKFPSEAQASTEAQTSGSLTTLTFTGTIYLFLNKDHFNLQRVTLINQMKENRQHTEKQATAGRQKQAWCLLSYCNGASPTSAGKLQDYHPHSALLYALSPSMKAALIQEPELAAHTFSTLRPCGTGSLDRSSPKSQGKPQHHDKTEMHTCPEQPKYPKHRYVQFWKLNYNHYKNWENKIKQMHSAFKSQCKTWKVPAWHITMLLDQTNRYPSSKNNFFRLGL